MNHHAPKPGFYYHYKHDPKGTVNNYAYEVIGIGRHTEEETHTVIYRPLYENTYLEGANYSIRPLGMFMEEVIKDGKKIPRFTLITDPKVIAQLEIIKKKMYS